MKPMEGLDILGYAHKLVRPKMVAVTLPDGWGIGVFDDPFGPVIAKLNRLVKLREKLGRAPLRFVRFGAHWGGQSHVIVPRKKLREKLPGYEQFAKENPQTRVYVAHSVEYAENQKTVVKDRVDMVREFAPSCVPVNSVWRGVTAGDAITERHGDVEVEAGEIVSWDGTNCYDKNVEAWKERNANALIRLWWGYRFNLREINDPGEVVPPPSRRTAKPSRNYTMSVVVTAKDPGTPPVVPGAKQFKRPEVFKSHAEDMKGVNDPRENKPVVICEAKRTLEVQTINGKKLTKVSRYSVSDGKYNRFYLKKWGWKLAKRAFELSGTEYVVLVEGDKKWGPVHPGKRTGYYLSS